MEDFKNRLIKMKAHMGKWARRREIYAYRVYDRDIPQYPYTIDFYEDHLYVCEYYTEAIASKKNYSDWQKETINYISEILGVSQSKMHVKIREKQKGGSQYEKFGQQHNFLEIRENGLKFLVNLDDYLDTGLFLDHRSTRSLIGNQIDGKRFLNLFSYTGSFSVYAARGGASEIVSVDTSVPYLEWLRENLKANNLDNSLHREICMDVREFLQNYNEKSFDVIYCDPPVFSKGKKLIRDFDVLRDHPDLIDNCLKLLNKGGILYFSTNFRKFKIQWKGNFLDISRETIPDDFKDKKIHVCYKIVKE